MISVGVNGIIVSNTLAKFFFHALNYSAFKEIENFLML